MGAAEATPRTRLGGSAAGADLPDHARLRDLDERAVAIHQEFGVGVGLAEIPHRAVIHDIGAAIRAEFDIGRPVEPANAADERLLEGCVVGKPVDVEC